MASTICAMLKRQPPRSRARDFGAHLPAASMSAGSITRGITSRLTGLTFTVALAAVALSLEGCSRSEAVAPTSTPVPIVGVVQPETASVQESLEYIGRIEPSQKIEVRSRVSGYLESIKFHDGQIVKAGDPLFVIDKRPFMAARDKAKAALAQANARHTLAASQFDRVSRLTSSGASSTDDVERARGELDGAKAAVMAGQAELRSAELELSFATVRAPISGHISDRRIDVGNYLAGAAAQGGVLTTIVAQSPAHAMIDLSEPDFQRLRALPPKQVQVALDGTVVPFTANVDFVDNEASARSGTIRLRATFSNADRAVIPGNFVRVSIPVGGPQAQMLVPDAAVLSDQTKKMVMVVDADGLVAARRVMVGGLSNGKRVVLSGLSNSDSVIVSGGQKVRPGDNVQVTKSAQGV